jgi:hypothetical protein
MIEASFMTPRVIRRLKPPLGAFGDDALKGNRSKRHS